MCRTVPETTSAPSGHVVEPLKTPESALRPVQGPIDRRGVHRITDHRVGLTTHGIPRVLAGELDPLIDAVAADEQARLLAAVGA